MNNYKIEFNPNKCVGCNACTVACIDQNDIDVSKGEKSFRNVFIEEDLSKGFLKLNYIMKSCLHCPNGPCAEVCPFECIKIDNETGFVIYNDSECTGCMLCVKACPYDAISFSYNGKVRKCDGCYVRVKYKMLPACVRNCPTEALTLKPNIIE